MEASKKYTMTCRAKQSFESVRIEDAKDAYKYARNLWGSDIHMYESCFILLLDQGNNIIGWAKISQGGVSLSVFDIKIVAKYAIDTLASGVILLHNHPSGGLEPSDHDIKTTNKMKEGLKLLDISVLDHLIITDGGYYSFSEHGRMGY